MPGTDRHVRLFEVRTYIRLRQFWVIIAREKASLALLACSIRIQMKAIISSTETDDHGRERRVISAWQLVSTFNNSHTS